MSLMISVDNFRDILLLTYHNDNSVNMSVTLLFIFAICVSTVSESASFFSTHSVSMEQRLSRGTSSQSEASSGSSNSNSIKISRDSEHHGSNSGDWKTLQETSEDTGTIDTSSSNKGRNSVGLSGSVSISNNHSEINPFAAHLEDRNQSTFDGITRDLSSSDLQSSINSASSSGGLASENEIIAEQDEDSLGKKLFMAKGKPDLLASLTSSISSISSLTPSTALANITLACSRIMLAFRRFAASVNAKNPASLASLLAFILLVVLMYANLPPSSTPSSSAVASSALLFDKDRSTNYRVKVLPDDLEDEELAALPKEAFSYLAMIDAGSSGCRAHVYRYGKLGSIDGPLYLLPNHVSMKVKPGLSTFAKNPSAAGASLADLVSFLREQVPADDWSVTPIWLKATAGLRMLSPSQSEAILDSVRSFLGDKDKSPFLFRSSYARIISGNEEGAFGWIAFNYLKRIIGPRQDKLHPQSPFAVVEMGGASSQVTQIASNRIEAAKMPQDYRYGFEIEGESFVLYTHSYLGYGSEQAREKLNTMLVSSQVDKSSGDNTDQDTKKKLVVKDPCLNTGYHRDSETPRSDVYQGVATAGAEVKGTSSADTCYSSLSKILPKNDNCDLSNSAASKSPRALRGSSPTFAFGCVYQPTFVTESKNFLVFENFYYVASAIGVLPYDHDTSTASSPPPTPKFPLKTTVGEFSEAASRICDLSLEAVQQSYPRDSQPKDLNSKWCFAASYVSAFLKAGLSLSEDKVVTVQKEVDGSEIEWALGAAYKEASDFLKRTNLRPT